MNPLSIYLHYPFCVSKCPYCDFNSYCNLKINGDLLLNGYLREIEFYGKTLGNRKIETVFFGGGTPSLMDSKFLAEILEKINNTFDVAADCEVSLEANPNSMDFKKMKEFKKFGVNRLSIGIQSLRNDDLKLLGRVHNRNEALTAIDIAQNIFGDRYSIDMIHSRPNQKLCDWEVELKEAIKLSSYHISVYQLIIEKSTPFYKNRTKVPGEDLGLDFLNLTRDILEDSGLEFYEISNYARPKYECKHNLVYWQNGEWIGIGAGAHGRINTDMFCGNYRIRYGTENIKTPNKWLEHVLNKGRGYYRKKYLSSEEFIEEFILMGLRIKNGINIGNLQKNITNVDSLSNFLNLDSINMLRDNKLVEFDFNVKNLNLTETGFLLLNSIIGKILK